MARIETLEVKLDASEAVAQLDEIVRLAFDRAFESIGETRDALAFDRQSARSYDADGRLHVTDCNISKANVCSYLGREIIAGAMNGEQLRGTIDPNKIYRLYRDPEELRAAADSFNNLQLMLVHAPVNVKSPKIGATVGCVSNVAFDGTYLKAGKLSVWTDEGIKLVESKKQAQLSSSYRWRCDLTPGTSPDGVAFDGVMRDIMGNHVALVEHGRAGPDVYVSDSQPSELPQMKRSALVAALLAALPGVTVSDEQKVAFDAALDVELSKLTKQPDPAPVALDADALRVAVDQAIAKGGYVTKADADKLANDARSAAVAHVNALHKAREDVRPLVGIVAFDSADEVYAFALKQSNVATEGVHASAYPALVEQVKARKAAPAPAAPTRVAADSAAAVSSAIPGLGRFAQA